jgi:hypothetical protein
MVFFNINNIFLKFINYNNNNNIYKTNINIFNINNNIIKHV